MDQFQIEIKQGTPLKVAAVRDVVADYGSMGPLFDELMGAIGEHQLQPAGPMMAVYYDTEYKEQEVDVEAAMPVSAEVGPLSDRVQVRELPVHKELVSLTLKGAYDQFPAAYEAIMDWVRGNGYRIIGPNREIYFKGPESGEPAEQWLSEIQFPVTKA